MTARPLLRAFFLGRRDYSSSYALMQELFEARMAGSIPDTLLLLEHEPVITLGSGAKPEHLLIPSDRAEQLGLTIQKTGRGGDVTMHLPGQLVAYPIVDLSPNRRDVRKYVQMLTSVMQEIVGAHGIDAGTFPGKIGLWIDLASSAKWKGETEAEAPAKIGAIGVRISRWVTQHGFALNLTCDLSWFRFIVPCGIREFGVTSLSELTGVNLSTRDAADRAAAILARHLERELELHDVAELTVPALRERALQR